jgi:hypothetical protein
MLFYYKGDTRMRFAIVIQSTRLLLRYGLNYYFSVTKLICMMRYIAVTLFFLCFVTPLVHAQTVNQTSGWLFLLNNTKINDKWGAYLDVQLRSADKVDYLRNFLFRPGVTYYINDKSEATLGYLLNVTFNRNLGTADNSLTEHRIWEQYIYKQKISTISLSHRFRLEQRFIEANALNNIFAQRFRYFVRFILPLEKNKLKFEEGAFIALQNEVFLNIQNKDELNRKVFDQNRAYLALGYRFSKKVDLEAGYMNQAIKGLNVNTVNNIVQLALYTRF